MSQILKVAVTGAGDSGSKQADEYAASGADEFAAAVANSPGGVGAITQQHGATACSDLHAVLSSTDAISPVAPSSPHYKIAGNFLKAGIHKLCEIPAIETMTATSEPVTGDIILHLIDRPVIRMSANSKLFLWNKVDIDKARVEAGNHRFTRSGASNISPQYDDSRFFFRRPDRQQPVQRLPAAVRGRA